MISELRICLIQNLGASKTCENTNIIWIIGRELFVWASRPIGCLDKSCSCYAFITGNEHITTDRSAESPTFQHFNHEEWLCTLRVTFSLLFYTIDIFNSFSFAKLHDSIQHYSLLWLRVLSVNVMMHKHGDLNYLLKANINHSTFFMSNHKLVLCAVSAVSVGIWTHERMYVGCSWG